jgi:hypothetical protein
MVVEGIILLVHGLRLGLPPFPFYGDTSACILGGAGILYLSRYAKLNEASHENLTAICFAGELLPNWAQLLDLAARLCPVSIETRNWFSTFTARNGVDDARTVIHHCRLLRDNIEQQRATITSELRRTTNDAQPNQIISAWIYALDTMIQQAGTNKTCSWTVEGSRDGMLDDSDGGDINLRRL